MAWKVTWFQVSFTHIVMSFLDGIEEIYSRYMCI
jgi:hypothetical protein